MKYLRTWSVWVVAVGVLLFAGVADAKPKKKKNLHPPAGLTWGGSPLEVNARLLRSMKAVAADAAAADPDRFLFEMRYAGDLLGLPSDHVAPMFWAGRLFALAASFSPTPTSPASLIWETLVDKLAIKYGKPDKRTRPMQILSLEAVLRLLPETANRTEIIALYTALEKDRALGSYVVLDIQIQTAGWIPEAVWQFDNGSTLKVVMRAGKIDAKGITELKPAVIYTRPDIIK